MTIKFFYIINVTAKLIVNLSRLLWIYLYIKDDGIYNNDEY